MKISNVEAIPLSFSMEKPIMDSLFFTNKRNVVLVRVETDEGVVGFGEAACYGGSLFATSIVIEKELKPILLGEDPCFREKIWRQMYKRYFQHGRGGILLGAISGVDIALWDLVGKKSGMPVNELLGGYTNRVRAYASGGFYQEGKGVEELVKEMQRYVANGFTAVKMKVGRVPSIPASALRIMPRGDACTVSLNQDVSRIKAVREAIGDEIDLLVDANNSWDSETAIRIAKTLEQYHIYYLEEPVPTEDITGSAKLAAATSIPIAGYETAYTRYEFRDLIVMKAVDIVQPDVVWAGGITECMKIAACASAYHLPCIPHCFSSAVCLAANLHFVSAIPNGELLEMDTSYNPLREELVDQPFQIDREGYVSVPSGPGLGITLNEKVIDKYKVHLEL